MAKMTNTSTIKIMLDGSQAENEVQRLRKQLKRVGEELAIVQEKFKGEREWDSGDTAEKLSKRIKELKKTQRSLKSALDAHITQITGVDSVLADRSAAAYNELTKKRTSLLNLLKRLRLDTEEEMRVYEETSKRLSKVQQEIGERDIDLKSPTTVPRAQEVLSRPEDYSTKEINEAIAAMTKFRDTKKADSEEWKHWNGYVRNGALFMEEFNQKVKTTNMEELHADLKNAKPTISDKDLNVLVKYWEEMAQGAKAGSTAQADFNKKLAEARDLQTARKREQGEKIATEVADQGQFGSSLSEMQQRLKLLQDYRTVIDSTKPDAYVRVDAAIEKLTQKIKESQAGFLSYADAMKRAEGLANGTFKGSISDLDKIKKVLDEYRGTLSTSDTAGLDKVNTALGNIEQKQKELQAGYMSYAQAMDKAGKVMDGSFEGSIADLEKLQKVLTEYRSSLDVKDSDALKDVDTRLESIAQKMQQLRPGFMSFQDALEKAKQISSGAFEGTIEDLDKLQKVLKEGMSAELNISDEEDLKTLKTTTALLDDIAKKQKELADINKRERSEATVEYVRKNISGVSPAELEEAIRLAKELQKTNGTSGKQYMELATFIGNAESRLKQWNDAVKELTMERQLGDVANLSKIALEEQKKYWQTMVDGASEGDAALDRYRENLKKVTEEEKKRIQQSAQQTIAEYNTGNWDKTIGDTREAVKQLQEYRNTLRTVGDDNALQEVDKVIEGLTLKTKQAEAGFLSFDEAMKRVADLDHFNGTLEDLEKIQKVLKEGMSKELNLSDPADLDRLKTTTALLDDIAKKQKELADINKREQSESKIAGVSGNIAGSSPAEIEEAIRLAKELQKTNGTSGKQYMELATFIGNAESRLKQWNDAVKELTMERQLGDVANLSKIALEEQKKYWQTMVDGASEGDAALDRYRENLKKVTEEEKKRIQQSAQQTIAEYNTGNWDKTIGDTREAVKQLQEYRNTLRTVGDDNALQEVDKVIEGLTLKTKQAEAGFLSFDEAMKRVADLDHFNGTLEDLEKIQKVLKEGMSKELNLSDPADLDRLKTTTALLDDIAKKQKELADINKREQSESKIAGVSGNIAGSSPAELEETIRLAKELQKMNGTSATQYQSLAKFINDAEAQLKKYNEQVKHAAMENQFLRLANLSKNALEEQRKYWQDVFDNAEKGTAKYIQAEQKLVDINKTLTDRKSDEAGAIMGNLPGSSVGDIERAIKMTEELMKSHSRGSTEYEIYAEEIKKAKEYLQSYVDMEKQVDMEDKWSRLRTLSTDALAEQKKYWQEMVNGAKQGTQELADYEAKLKDVVEEERMRLDNKATKVLADPTSFSVKEVQDSIKAYEQLRDAQRTGSGNWEYYNQKIEEARETLKHYNDEAKKTTMEGRLGGIATASTASLAEQKKYWQEMVDGAERGTQALKDYQDNLAKVTAEERTRLQNAAQQTITDYNTGNWNKTIGETKEAIKQLQEYRNTLNEKNDSKALADVDEVLTELTQKTKEAEQGYMSLTEALIQAELASKGQFQGTVEELQKLKKRLEEIRNTEINIGDKNGLKKVDEALAKVDKKLDEVKNGVYDFNKAVNQPWAVSFNDLKRAAAQLEEELKNCTEDVEDFAEKSNQLRNVNARIKDLNDRWKEHDGTLKSTIKRLASYVAVYGGFNFVWGKLKEAASANLQLSDSMADVQKTTAMTSAEIADLGKSLDAMDTRTSQAELYNLAATAGQLGIRGKESILGFVNASNMITVALNELGAEGTATLMKIADLTGDISEHGTEKALLKIGSAINELTASTTATAGPMVDFISRFGGVASAADIATHQMAAVGATADALKQEIEVTGTTMNKVVGAITSNTRELAAAVNVDYQALNELIKSGKTMDAIVMVFEAMSNAGGVSAEALKALGSEGDRMNRVITSFVGNLDMLKNNLRTSAAAFDEMTSIQNEYNIKNENAAALWERIQNTLLEIVSNPRFVGWLTDMLNSLKGFTDWLTQSEGAARLLIGTLLTLIGIKVVSFFTALGKSLYELKLMLASAKTWFTTLGSQFSALITLLGRTTGAVNILKTAIGGLFRILLKHPFLLVATAVGIAVTKFIKFKDANEKAAEAAKALAEEEAKLINQFEEERSKAEQLTSDIKKLNVSNDERKRLITEFNNAYGKYLGYMLDEKATAEEVAAAYDLVNAALTAKHQLELVGIKRSQRNQSFANEQVAYVQELRAALTNLGVDDANVSKTIAFVNTLVMQGKNASEILTEVNNLLGKDFKLTEVTGYRRNAEGQQVAFFNDTDLGAALKSYAEFGKQYKEDMQTLDEETQRINDNAVQERFKKQQDYLNTELENLKKLSTGTEEELKQTKQAYQSYFSTLKTYYSQATKEQKVELEKSLANLKDAMSKLPKLKELAASFTFDPWGKKDNLDNWTTFAETIKNLDKASPKSLAATLDAIEKESQDLSAEGLKNFNSMFQTTFDTTSIEKFNAQVKGLAKQIKDRLKELGRGTDGNFLWGSEGGGKSAKKKVQEEYRAAISALEAYFNERETLIREKGLKEGKTQVQINQELERLQTEKLNDEIQLRKLLLEEYWQESTFDPKKYKGVISGTDYFKDKNMEYLNELRVQLEKWGVAMEDGMKKQLTDRMVKLSEQALKLREKINKILLQDDFNEQVAQQYLDSLQELGLLFGLAESEITNTNKEEGESRLAYMREWAKESYNLNAQQLQAKIEQEAAFSKWRIGRTAEDYEALLIQLRKFHDDQAEAEKKHAERMKRITDARFKSSGQQEESENRIQDSEAKLDMAQRMQEFGVGGEQVVNDYEIELIKQKIAAEEQWLSLLAQETIAKQDMLRQDIEAAERRMALEADETKRRKIQDQINQLKLELESEQNAFVIASNESINKMLELQANATDKYINNFTHYFSYLKEYQEGIDTFAQSMGEGIYGSKEDRQQAAKDLLVSVATTSKNLLQMWLTQLATRRLIDDMEVEQTRATEMRKQAIKLQSLVQDGTLAIGSLEAQAAIAQAENLMDISRGIGKEVAKKGLIGLAIGAAISAALSALLGAAIGGVNKAKSEVAAATGANTGRLATGMLTYKKGKYPTLGNDGVVYDAQYEGSNIKTGIYRGGAHFGIFSEKKPEAIIDGDTTQRLIMNHPDIWKAIVTLSKNGRLDSGMGMRTFATGNINDLARQAQDMEASATTDNSAQMAQMQATLDRNSQVMAQLMQVLAGGIKANINMYGEDGMYKSMKKAEKYAGRVGYK